jgi:hypothetical protein
VTVAWLMLFGGFIIVVAGWKNISVMEALRGNFDVPKAQTTQAAAK